MRSVQAFGVSDIGRRRLSNEDAFLVDERLGLYAVADGMGGHSAGEIASQHALETLHDMILREQECLAEIEHLSGDALTNSMDTMPPQMRKTLRVMESAIQAATYMVFGLGEANPEQKGMGTTISVLLLRGDFAVTAQVGDSRIYLVRDGIAQQITEDHTLVAWQIRKGLITEEEARHSRQKNVITRAVGSREYVQVDTRSLTVRPRDRFLLCSDGLYGYVEREELIGILQGSVEEGAKRAVGLANQRGGRDNITAVVVEVG